MAQARIRKQVQLLKQIQAMGQGVHFQSHQIQDNIHVVNISMDGPQGTPYEDGKFYMKITLQNFPFKPPTCKFMTPIYNPVIQSDGSIHCCYDFIDPMKWAPTYRLSKIILHFKQFLQLQKLQSIQCSVNFTQAHNQFLRNRQIFIKKAKQMTIKYATKSKGACKTIDMLNSYGQNTEILDLSINSHFQNVQKFRDQGCKQLSKKSFPQLKQLCLMNNQISDKGMAYLCQNLWTKLQKLDLGLNKLTSQSMKYLRISNWPNIKLLNLSDMKIGKSGIRRLTKCNLPLLTELNLMSCWITDEGIQYFVMNNWPELKRLFLDNNLISDFGSISLMKSNFRSLEEIKMIERNRKFKFPLKHLYSQVWPSLNNIGVCTTQA